jgi:ABC-type branched-subunit amino acid transport system ATPase component
VEQYLEFAGAICDRFYVLDRGGVALEGAREDFRMDELKGYLSA